MVCSGLTEPAKQPLLGISPSASTESILLLTDNRQLRLSATPIIGDSDYRWRFPARHQSPDAHLSSSLTPHSMLTGEVSMTEGEAYLMGYSIQKDLREIQQRIGYCPQFDALIGERLVIIILLNYTSIIWYSIETVTDHQSDDILVQLLLPD